MAWNNLMFKRTEEDSVLRLRASTQTKRCPKVRPALQSKWFLRATKHHTGSFQSCGFTAQPSGSNTHGVLTKEEAPVTALTSPRLCTVIAGQCMAPECGASRNSPSQRVTFCEIGNRTASRRDFLLVYLSQVVPVWKIKSNDLWNEL